MLYKLKFYQQNYNPIPPTNSIPESTIKQSPSARHVNESVVVVVFEFSIK